MSIVLGITLEHDWPYHAGINFSSSSSVLPSWRLKMHCHHRLVSVVSSQGLGRVCMTCSLSHPWATPTILVIILATTHQHPQMKNWCQLQCQTVILLLKVGIHACIADTIVTMTSCSSHSCQQSDSVSALNQTYFSLLVLWTPCISGRHPRHACQHAVHPPGAPLLSTNKHHRSHHWPERLPTSFLYGASMCAFRWLTVLWQSRIDIYHSSGAYDTTTCVICCHGQEADAHSRARYSWCMEWNWGRHQQFVATNQDHFLTICITVCLGIFELHLWSPYHLVICHPI